VFYHKLIVSSYSHLHMPYVSFLFVGILNINLCKYFGMTVHHDVTLFMCAMEQSYDTNWGYVSKYSCCEINYR